ncbi:MAG: UbiA family prenyltransferase [Sandaracinaceae bacterium]
MTTARSAAPRHAFGDALAIARYHIVLVAMAACVVFGWLMTDRYLPWIALVCGLDWFLINLLNRVTDVDEDLENGIRGTERVAARRRLLTVGGFTLMGGSIVLTHLVWPELTALRVIVQAIGLAYNYDVVPTPRGLSRLKEIYFFKNFGSSCLFVLTGFLYPLAAAPQVMRTEAIVALVLFFVPFELTYEILYDLRDLEGDRQEGIPTYPVVHGPKVALQIIDALLLGSALVLGLGLGAGWLGLREGLMLAAPLLQLVFYRPRVRRGITSADCIHLTHLGTGLLLFYLAGTAAWSALGMPNNIYLVQ